MGGPPLFCCQKVPVVQTSHNDQILSLLRCIIRVQVLLAAPYNLTSERMF